MRRRCLDTNKVSEYISCRRKPDGIPPRVPPRETRQAAAQLPSLRGQFFWYTLDMLSQKIKDDMKEAMKAKDDLRVQTLRGAMAAFTNELVAKGKKPTEEVDDAMVLAVLKRLAKQRRDSADQFEKGGRPEMAQKEMKELAIIEGYLPQMASRDEVLRVAQAKKIEMNVDAAGKGKLMGAVMKELGGNADGGLVKEVIESLFS